MKRVALVILSASLISVAVCAQTSEPSAQSSGATAPQSTYQPKFPGDKAHSDAEAAALGYMRTVLTAEKLYKKKHGGYATSLASLVGTGSFTKRMASPDRGDYKVGFRGTAEKFSLTMEPKQFDVAHRAFFADETGAIRAEDDKPATASSPVLK
jgi:ABC-type oligopeptide transport system substrate-binding subunit